MNGLFSGKTIEERIKLLIEINARHSDEFLKARPARQLYRIKHPTEICAFKCMDGRVHVPYITQTPVGIIRPYRNIGGYFDLGWPLLGEDLTNWVSYGISKGKKSLILVTYHYSHGDTHRGCAGFNYDHEAALAFTVEFHSQINRLFGENNQVVFPVVVGLETDTDALVIHSEDPSSKIRFLCSEGDSNNPEHLLEVMTALHPNMDKVVKQDLLPLIQGNISHIADVQRSGRDLSDMQHREFILGVGRGFDWLHEPNTAIIVGPYSPDLSQPISKAIGIISDNMEAGRINDDGLLVLLSAPFRESGVDRNRAKLKAIFCKKYVEDILKEKYPDLLPKVRFLAVTIDEHTRRIMDFLE